MTQARSVLKTESVRTFWCIFANCCPHWNGPKHWWKWSLSKTVSKVEPLWKRIVLWALKTEAFIRRSFRWTIGEYALESIRFQMKTDISVVDSWNKTKTLVWSKMICFVSVEKNKRTIKNVVFTGFLNTPNQWQPEIRLRSLLVGNPSTRFIAWRKHSRGKKSRLNILEKERVFYLQKGII